MTATNHALLTEAVELTRAAGELTLRWFQSRDLEVDRKGDGTPVTEADRAAERLLRDEIGRRYPDDAILGEEEADCVGSSGRTWIIDPIDGTKAFARGVPLYSNLLAIYDDEGPAIGVVNLPGLGETVYAGRGLGCFADGRPARVSERKTLAESSVCTSGFGRWRTEQLEALRDAGPLVRTWGDGYGFTLVATGRIEAMVDPAVSLWDIAPMPVILHEAGGRFTDLSGDAEVLLDTTATVSGLATNGHVHDQLAELLGS
jgi:histidinol-phosphatase